MAWAESLRAADVHAVTNGGITTLRHQLVQVAARARDAGLLPPRADPGVVAMVMVSLVIGWVVQRLIAGVADRETYVGGIRSLLAA
jgi:hypothetical protein